MADRPLDLVLFGGTGFTGGLTALELARRAPAGTRWGLAGRNREKLEALRERVGGVASAAAPPELLLADVQDTDSLRELAEQTSVLATTVGPYIHHGEPLVAACAAAGTDYADLTGEPEFVDLMWLRHHAEAERTGARLVHACGFDSIPHDLGAQFTVEQLPEGTPLIVEGFVRAGGTFSAGTYHSALTAFSRVRQYNAVHRRRSREEPRPAGRQARGVRGRPRVEPAVDAWAVPFPSIDPQVVLRSARALERYGPDFRYGHNIAVKRLPVAAAGVAGVVTLFTAAQVPPVRRLLMGRMASGDGPSAEQIAKGWFSVRFVGRGGDQRVVTEVCGGDPGYGDTAKMLAETTLCLAHDALPETAGQVTTAQALGGALRERLEQVGITFRVVEGPQPAAG